jgi:hypothetical protein
MGEADEGETSLKKGAKLVFKDWKVGLAFQAGFRDFLLMHAWNR